MYKLRGKEAVFVFGSNLSGVHGAGAAKFALQKRGAVLGVGVGLQGCSYALPTKGLAPALPVLPLGQVIQHASDFKKFASENPSYVFQLTAVGCGLAGYKNEEIAPLFMGCSQNVLMPPEWRGLVPDRNLEEHYWTYEEIPS